MSPALSERSSPRWYVAHICTVKLKKSVSGPIETRVGRRARGERGDTAQLLRTGSEADSAEVLSAMDLVLMTLSPSTGSQRPQNNVLKR